LTNGLLLFDNHFNLTDPMYFRNLVLSAFVIALVAGLFLSIYQEFLINPIILNSETYEVVEPIEGHQAWQPSDGIERSGFSFVANFLLCFSYGLLLLCLIAVKPTVKISQGIFWGLAAYLSVFVAPALGLPPEIPGMEAASLGWRQLWWLLAVVSTGIGLWLIAFSSVSLKGVGLFILIMPHITGAPQPDSHGFINTDPQAVLALTHLWHDFIIQTSLANGLLWLIIGILAIPLNSTFILPLDHSE